MLCTEAGNQMAENRQSIILINFLAHSHSTKEKHSSHSIV